MPEKYLTQYFQTAINGRVPWWVFANAQVRGRHVEVDTVILIEGTASGRDREFHMPRLDNRSE